VASLKVSRPVVYGLVAAVGIAGFLLTQPEEVRRKGAPRRTRATTAGPAAPDGFTELDRTAKFPRVTGSLRNVFVPLVRKEGVEAGLQRPPNQFPLATTGSETPWVFTGTAVVDQAPRALVENPATGESLFVGPGDRVGLASIVQVGPTYLVARGRGGETVRLELLQDLEDTGPDLPTLEAGSFAPVTPSLQGPIVGAREPSQRNRAEAAVRTTTEEPANNANAQE
jgi:hypothetical protein